VDFLVRSIAAVIACVASIAIGVIVTSLRKDGAHFSLARLLQLVTSLAVLLGTLRIAAGNRTHLYALAVAAMAGSVATFAAWYLDQRVLRCDADLRMLSALALLGFATWLIVLIQLAFWFELAGGAGTIQYASDDPDGMVLFHARVLAMFGVLGALPLALATVVGSGASMFTARGEKWRPAVTAVLALSAFAIAFWMFGAYQFFPTA
jgi:hypothetical protein